MLLFVGMLALSLKKSYKGLLSEEKPKSGNGSGYYNGYKT